MSDTQDQRPTDAEFERHHTLGPRHLMPDGRLMEESIQRAANAVASALAARSVRDDPTLRELATGRQAALVQAAHLRSLMHRARDGRTEHHLTVCGVRTADVPHTNGDGTPLTCTDCAVLVDELP